MMQLVGIQKSHANAVSGKPFKWSSLVSSCLILCCALAFSTGCTISKKSCLQDDWQTRGYQDGKDGKSPDILTAYAKTCSKHGITPDPTAYAAGFDVGIVEYCTPENGFDEGEDNDDYSGACPANLEPAFLASYIEGLGVAADELSIEYDRDTLRLDELRDRRDQLRADGAGHGKEDKRINRLNSSLQYNTSQRRSINKKIRRWKARM